MTWFESLSSLAQEEMLTQSYASGNPDNGYTESVDGLRLNKSKDAVTGPPMIKPLALIQIFQVHSSSLHKIFQSALEKLYTPRKL